MTKLLSRIYAIASLLIASVSVAGAAEITVYSTIGVKHSLEELATQFEKASGHKMKITFGTAAALAKRIQAGEQADLLVLTKQANDTLTKDGKVLDGSAANFTTSVMAVAVKKGAPKPDITTADAFKATMLNAKSIAYPDPAGGGFSGVYFAQLSERLGIADQVKAKAKFPPDNFSAKLVATGEAEIAVMQKPELIMVEGIDIVGPYPAELNVVTVYTASVTKDSKQPDAASAAVKFLQSPDAAAVWKRDGFDAITGPKGS